MTDTALELLKVLAAQQGYSRIAEHLVEAVGVIEKMSKTDEFRELRGSDFIDVDGLREIGRSIIDTLESVLKTMRRAPNMSDEEWQDWTLELKDQMNSLKAIL